VERVGAVVPRPVRSHALHGPKSKQSKHVILGLQFGVLQLGVPQLGARQLGVRQFGVQQFAHNSLQFGVMRDHFQTSMHSTRTRRSPR
jgi:hypothetical protein